MDFRRDPADAVHPEDRERVTEAWMNCLEDKQPFTCEYRVCKPRVHTDPITGEEIVGECWVFTNATPELDENGEIHHVSLCQRSTRRRELIVIDRSKAGCWTLATGRNTSKYASNEYTMKRPRPGLPVWRKLLYVYLHESETRRALISSAPRNVLAPH